MSKIALSIIALALSTCGGSYDQNDHQSDRNGYEPDSTCHMNLILKRQERYYDNGTGEGASQLVYGSPKLIPEGCQRLRGMPIHWLSFVISVRTKYTAGSVTEFDIDNRRLFLSGFDLIKGENNLGLLNTSDWAGPLNSLHNIIAIISYPDAHIRISERPDMIRINILKQK